MYIPCYFNNVKEREDNFLTVIKQYLKFGYTVLVYWMNENIPPKTDNVEYIISTPVNSNIARNELLKIFYNSDEKECLLSDDDTILNNKLPKINVDCISYTNDYNKCLLKTEEIGTGLLYIKNFKQLYGKSIFFDEKLEANQDLDFGINLNSQGILTYRYSTEYITIFKGESSMFKSNMSKINKKKKALNYINNKYGRNSKKDI